MKGFVVYPTYRIKENKAYVYLYGRLENGESFLTINENRPYFFIREKDLKKTKEINKERHYEIKKTEFKDFNEDKVVKIILDIPREVPVLRKEFQDKGIGCYEADIRFAQRFLIDNNIKCSLRIEGDFEKGEKVDRIYTNPGLMPAVFKPELRVLSIDIETNRTASEVFSIALYSENYREVLIHSDKKIKNAKSFENERAMLGFFKEKIIELDPDIITGWNVVDFDINVLKKRFEHYKIPFTIGRSGDKCSIRTYDSFFKDSRANIPGRIVLDGIMLSKISFLRLEDYKLDTAAKTFLGESKLKTFYKFTKAEEIERLFKDNPQELADYNLKDAELVYRILKKKKLIDLTVQRSLLTGMQLDMVKASIASLDSLYIRETMKLGYVCNTSNYNEREARIKGGYVRDSIPGIYEFVSVLDFKSLYPSIIRTFNIDPLRYVGKDRIDNYKKSELIEAPNKAHFLKKEGILPLLIHRLWQMRDNAKKRNNKEESYAIKITMNSFFGVLANPMCRFYNLEIANAITSFGRFFVKKTEKIIEEKYDVKNIYSDTDSVFIKTNAKTIEESEKLGEKIADYVNKYYNDFVEKEYGKKSFLELQFEKTYIRFLMPQLRKSETGAKKRYAGLLLEDGKEKIDFTGLEFVRRDWTELSKKFQLEILDRIFHKKEITDYMKDFVNNLKKGNYDELLVYKKAIRKKLSAYVKTTPPHVKAARKLAKVTSNIISYVMTTDGPEPLEKLKHKIDYEHYIEKQIKPIADSVLVFYDKKFDELIKGSSQKTLFGY
ncbi:DNA polymerase II [Candidatus Woesearchaeota archaeon]|nr:DNA polymerase II [Candidatus Woesearchaeota archaeon]